MLQSMAPMFLIVFILNFNFIMEDTICQFLYKNLWTLICEVILLCLVLYSIGIFVHFKYFSEISGDLPSKVVSVSEDKEASLSFFLTYVLPISIYQLDNVRNVVAFVLIVVLMFALMSKTNLFYANPILCLIGYRVYHIKYMNDDTEKIVLSLDDIKADVYTSTSIIESNVLIGKIMEDCING